jgi:hypothetical protein
MATAIAADMDIVAATVAADTLTVLAVDMLGAGMPAADVVT